jgi:GH24 family phage-related lysozyme (muramidase)
MRIKWSWIITFLVGVLVLVLWKMRKKLGMFPYLRQIFVKFEGFRSKPYWDFHQWSWGYGTRVPGSSDDADHPPGGEIDKAKAMVDSFAHVSNDITVLMPLIKKDLSDKQLAAVFSFAYGAGQTPAKRLISRINEGDPEQIEYGFKAYNKVRDSGGSLVVSTSLNRRREYEFNLFMGKV